MIKIRNGKTYLCADIGIPGEISLYLEDQMAWTTCGNLNYGTNLEMSFDEFLDIVDPIKQGE